MTFISCTIWGRELLRARPLWKDRTGLFYLYTVLCVRSRILGVHEGGRDNLRGGCTRLASSEKGVYGLEHVETDEREGRQFDVRESRVLSCFLVRSRGSGMWLLIRRRDDKDAILVQGAESIDIRARYVVVEDKNDNSSLQYVAMLG